MVNVYFQKANIMPKNNIITYQLVSWFAHPNRVGNVKIFDSAPQAQQC
jgi:hypothetical protein